MPLGEWDRRGGRPIAPGEKAQVALTPEEMRNINALRAPSERVGEYALCGARAKVTKTQPDGTCTRKAGWGTDHVGVGYCKYHGGNTEAGRKSAARTYGRAVIEKEKVLMAKERWGGDRALVSITPEEALLEEVRRSVALVRWLEDRIGQWREQGSTTGPDQQWEPNDLGGLPDLMAETFKGNATFTNEREWLILYRDERQHAAKVAKMAIDAGIAQRMVTLAEDQGRMLAHAIRAVLDALDLTPHQQHLVPQVVPGVLRSVTSGMPLPSATHATPAIGR